VSGGTIRDIVVVGAGAAGALTAMHLLRGAAAEGDSGCRVRLIGPGATGRGLAFGTNAAHHLLNVPASGMSALRDQPDHFLRWLAGRAGPHDFVPRGLYGRYLADTLEAAAALDGAPRLLRLFDQVVGLGHRPDDPGAPVTLRLRSGQSIDADAVVLALGNFPADQRWAPPALRHSPLFVADPWAPGAFEALPDDSDLLLVGTGLTMVDVALTVQRPGRVVHAVSRHGLVPQPHATAPAAGRPVLPVPPDLDAKSGLDPLRRAVLGHLAAARRVHGDWRPGFDSLRPLTSALWQQLPRADQARFFADDLRLWEVHRHRIPPVSDRALRDAVDGGRVAIGSGSVVGAEAEAGALRVELDGGRTLRVGAVVNCTGSQGDLTRIDDPLVSGLLADGLGCPAPVGGGFDTAPDGRLLPGSPRPPAPLWTLGSLRRGNLLESTAIPEIRCQAEDLARTVRLPG